jgi:hypothetical protein
MNGTFAFMYSGKLSLGIAIFTIAGQRFTGADCGGGRYDGTIIEDPSSRCLQLFFDRFIPGGISFGRGHPPLTPATLALTFPPDFGAGEPIKLEIGPDTVTIMVNRVPDRWAAYSRGFSMWPELPNNQVLAAQLLGRRLN